MRMESTPIETCVPPKVIVAGRVSGLGVAFPVIGIANCENVPVTPRQPLLCVVFAVAGCIVTPRISATVPTAIRAAPRRVRNDLPALLLATQAPCACGGAGFTLAPPGRCDQSQSGDQCLPTCLLVEPRVAALRDFFITHGRDGIVPKI